MEAAANSAHKVKRRRPWLAGLMTLIGPVGLGQVYNGDGKKALTFWLTIGALLCLMRPLGVLDTFLGGALVVFLYFSFFVFVFIDAVWVARTKKEIELKWYNRWYVYLLVILVPMLIPQEILKGRIVGYEAFRIPSHNMTPTLRIGDHIIVSRVFYRARSPQRGDIVVFTREDAPKTKLIQRIIGLPGDTVELRGTRLSINGRPYSEDYARYEEGGRADGNFGPATVPADHLLLLGDNRDRSKDSRFWDTPFLPLERLIGKVLYIYYSSDSMERVGVRLVLPDRKDTL